MNGVVEGISLVALWKNVYLVGDKVETRGRGDHMQTTLRVQTRDNVLWEAECKDL